MSGSTDQSAGQTSSVRDNFLLRLVGVIARIGLTIAGVMLLAIVGINGWNVFSRYILFSALSWAEEGMVFLMMAGVFIGSMAVTWDRAHISIDALVMKLSPGPRAVVEWLGVLISTIVLWTVAWLSWGVVLKLRMFEQTSDALHMPVWIPQVTLPIALATMPVVMALALIRRGRPKPGEIE